MPNLKTVGKILDVGLIPVVRATSVDEAMAIAEAIALGGVSILEITMTVPGAVEAIERVASRYGKEVLVGAGTVLDPETARACILAGAEFIVTPSLKASTIEMCRRYSKVVIPGALTPTEVVTAWEAGADFVKVFPCDNVGGAKYIKALKGPFPQIDLIPTGGVNLNTAEAFIAAGSAALAVGSELVDKAAVAAQDFRKITENARKFMEAVRSARSKR
ncbi:MAG: bifunctional 4-hydroxy-2-oxoglutarate aldolase/2-dehydro-3-deoxy-phosphogluconate aldolase [Acidimicrobiia bacterium]|nr:bifunctional 4-hydroxy-2-oxoglutarate aldolase/2-dehydro-3-deoxy-phosphogluconate aldolase [Acidimicrobiia bacterium]